MTPAVGPIAAELFAECSNWGRWGSDDQLGTLNLITEDVKRRAVATITSLDIVPLGKILAAPSTGDSTILDARREGFSAVETLTLAIHGFAVTHIDAIGHNWLNETLYNGRTAGQVLTAEGLTFGSVLAMPGILTRGVLLDVAAVRGVDRLGPADRVTAADLDAAEQRSGTRIESGDAVFVRIGGRGSGLAPDDAAAPPGASWAGLGVDAVVWLRRRDVGVYSGDCIEAMPSGVPDLDMPLHQLGQAAMGLAILDNPDMPALLEACDRAGRCTFALVVAPLRVHGGTGSAVNPLAIF